MKNISVVIVNQIKERVLMSFSYGKTIKVIKAWQFESIRWRIYAIVVFKVFICWLLQLWNKEKEVELMKGNEMKSQDTK